MTTRPGPSLTLRVARTFAAARARVFAAWTSPESLRRWFGPKGFISPLVEVDLRVGGAYRIALKAPSGELMYAGGTYREISPPRRLVFTWAWEGDDFPETVVTLEFHERGGSTEVVLIHEGLPTEESRLNHQEGWEDTLERMEGDLT